MHSQLLCIAIYGAVEAGTQLSSSFDLSGQALLPSTSTALFLLDALAAAINPQGVNAALSRAALDPELRMCQDTCECVS